MAYKMHCDLCDAVIPEGTLYVYMVRSDELANRDWRHERKTMACYPCLAVLLGPLPEGVREDMP